MKIILLPGMDGTGLLFGPFISLLALPCEVISFASVADQSYEEIYAYIKGRLPCDDFYLVAESFSGPLAARLASENIVNMRGIIFVATFLSCPSKVLVKFAKFLPLKLLLKLPFSSMFVKRYLIGNKFPIGLFYSAIDGVTDSELKGRLLSLERLRSHSNKVISNIPAMYLCAKNDLFVSKHHMDEFLTCFPEISIVCVQGLHFLLQSNPECCAKLISDFVSAE